MADTFLLDAHGYKRQESENKPFDLGCFSETWQLTYFRLDERSGGRFDED